MQPLTRNQVHAIFAFIEWKHEIVMRGHFSCCNSCAHGELSDVGAYGFYHVQSTDAAAQTGTLYIGHGPDVGVPEKIVEAMRGLGLDVEWDGDEFKTIKLAVDAASFDLTNVANIPADAETVMHEGTAVRVWKDGFATQESAAWQVRCVTGDNAWWHDSAPTREEALDSGIAAINTWLENEKEDA